MGVTQASTDAVDSQVDLFHSRLRDNLGGIRRHWRPVALWSLGAVVSVALLVTVVIPALAERIAAELLWLRGDGRGGLGHTESVSLPGVVTALLVADVDEKIAISAQLERGQEPVLSRSLRAAFRRHIGNGVSGIQPLGDRLGGLAYQRSGDQLDR